jgi:NAD(P)-dependent dehydrogenase (short-subunit alcohol dehydrogenase family)
MRARQDSKRFGPWALITGAMQAKRNMSITPLADKRICLITGATGGIGKATATKLAAQGFTVVMAARDAGKAESVQKEIAAVTGNQNIDYIPCDLKSLKQVRQLAGTFRQRYPRLDVYLASSENAGRVSGAYFANGQPKQVKTRFNTEENRDLLWSLSVKSLQEILRVQ